MFPRFAIPTGLRAMGDTEDGMGGIDDADNSDGNGRLGWTAGGMVEIALPDASDDELSTLTYHSSKMLYPFAYWEIRSCEFTIRRRFDFGSIPS